MIVRDPVVVTAGLPRFLAPGDAAQSCGSTSPTPTARPATTTLPIETNGEVSTGSAALPEKVTLDRAASATP